MKNIGFILIGIVFNDDYKDYKDGDGDDKWNLVVGRKVILKLNRILIWLLMIMLMDLMKMQMMLEVDSMFIPFFLSNGFQLCISQKPKPRGWMHRLALPEELMMQLFSLRRQNSSPERGREPPTVSREILELIMTFSNGNSDDSSDYNGGDTAEDD